MRRTYRYAAMTKDEAQRRDWTFYEAVIFSRAAGNRRPLIIICCRDPSGEARSEPSEGFRKNPSAKLLAASTEACPPEVRRRLVSAAASNLGAHIPGGKVLLLFLCQGINSDSHGLQLKARDLSIYLGRNRINLF